MKTYKFGNIERKFYPTGFLQYEFILSPDDRIIRSKLISSDGSSIYSHTDFSQEEITHLRNGGELEIPNQIQIINYIYNEPILNGLENIFNSIPYFVKIIFLILKIILLWKFQTYKNNINKIY